MNGVARHDRLSEQTGERALVEADHFGMTFWPAIDSATGSVQLRRMMPDGVSAVIWRRFAAEGEARDIYDWMSGRPDQWHYWGRLAIVFGEHALEDVAVLEALLDAEAQATQAEQNRLEHEDRERLHRKITLYILDNPKKRPGLSFESGDETKPFFVMRFSEKWERERVFDWLRCQSDRFVEFRDLYETEGAVALERAIIAGMRVTENEMKVAGTASGGRRPLRFWRGE